MALRFLERQARKISSVNVTTNTFLISPSRDSNTLKVRRVDLERETDPKRLSQRQKQIKIGKDSEIYKKYIQLVPKSKRRRRGRIPIDPCTPDIHQKCSKRSFDGQVKAWKRQLHALYSKSTTQISVNGTEEGARSSEDVKPAKQSEEIVKSRNFDYIFESSGLAATTRKESQMGFFLED